MKNLKSSVVVLCAVLSAVLVAPEAHGFYSPVSVSIIPPVQFPPSDFSVTGARVSIIYGRHRDIYGLDIGLLGNITEQEFVGIAVAGGFNMTHGNTTALLQIAGLANVNTNRADIYGAQIAALLNRNDGASTMTGVQLALVNYVPHTVVRGFQIGLYNKSQTVYGFQIGLVNVADDLHGLQIGLANFHNKGLFVVSPILNFGF